MPDLQSDRTAAAAGWEAALVDTVVALREELQGLRSAAQLRAIIETAKGVLVERHHISLDEAFDRLRVMSQEHNVRLVEVAATVVGVALPDAASDPPELPEQVLRDRLPASRAASPAWKAMAQQPDVRAGVLTALVDAVAGAASQGDAAAQLLAELLAPQGVVAVAMYRVAAGGSLRMVGQSGIPGDVVASWHTIPPSPHIPYVRSVREAREIYWEDRAARAAEFAVAATSAYEAAAVVPISDAASVVGVVGLMWSTAQSFDEDRRAAITATVRRVAPLMLRNVTEADPELEWLRTLLSLHLDPWLLLEGVPGHDGHIRDFVVQDASPALPEAGQWVGRRLLEIWPSVAYDGTGQALSGLARTGGAWTMTVPTASGVPWGVVGSRVRAVRMGRRVALVWRPGTG